MATHRNPQIAAHRQDPSHPSVTAESHISHVPEEGFKRPESAQELFDLATAHRQASEVHEWVFAAKWISEQRRAA